MGWARAQCAQRLDHDFAHQVRIRVFAHPEEMGRVLELGWVEDRTLDADDLVFELIDVRCVQVEAVQDPYGLTMKWFVEAGLFL